MKQLHVLPVAHQCFPIYILRKLPVISSLSKMESVVKSTTVAVLGESVVHDALFQCGPVTGIRNL